MRKTYILLVLFILVFGVSSAYAKNDIIDQSKKQVTTSHFTKTLDEVKFNKNINDVKHFNVEKSKKLHSVKVSLDDEQSEITAQTIGVPIADLEGFTELVQVQHFNEAGENDYIQIIKPHVVNGIAYIEVAFTSVTITPYISLIRNGGFEEWSAGEDAPDDWAVTAITQGGSQSTVAHTGSYSYMITGSGDYVRGEIIQSDATTTPGNYTVGAWVKVVNSSGVGNICVNTAEGVPYALYGMAIQSSDTDWTWIEHRQYINSTGFGIRVYADAYPIAGSKYYVDDLVMSPDYSYSATETSDATHIYQNFTYTPSGVYSTATFTTWLQSENITLYSFTTPQVTVDGVARTARIAGHQVMFDTSSLSATPHQVNVTVTFVPRTAAEFTANDTSVVTGEWIQFTDQSTGTPTEWLWDFGDGYTSTEQNPVYAYYSSGAHSVSLTATNAISNNTTTKSNYVTVVYVAPVASFTSLKTGAYTFNFTDTSSSAVTDYLWDFGDGTTSTEENPSHDFGTNGTFAVKLTASNPAGSDDITNNVVTTAQKGNSAIATADSELVMLNVGDAHSFNITSNITLDYTQFMVNSIPMNVSGNELIYAFTEGGMFYSVSATGYSGDGIPSNTVTWRVQVRREMANASEKLVPFDETNYNNFKNNFTKFDSTNMSTNAVAPFTDLIGRSFYLILFVLPFVLLWQKQQRMTIPATLALITGCLFIGFIPDQYRDFITYAIILSFAVNLYFMGRERI